MPGLKSFVSKIRLGKKDKIVEDAQLHGEHSEDVKPAASTRHRANVKTGKLRKRSQSRVDLFDGIYDEQWNGMLDGNWPAPAPSHFKRGFSLRPSASRVNSMDVEKAKASLAEFDREKHTMAAMRAMRTSETLLEASGKMKSAVNTKSYPLRSNFGLKVNVENMKARDGSPTYSLFPRDSIATERSPEIDNDKVAEQRRPKPESPENTISRIRMSRYGLPVHPNNDPASYSRAGIPSSNNPFRDAMVSQRSWAEPVCASDTKFAIKGSDADETIPTEHAMPSHESGDPRGRLSDSDLHTALDLMWDETGEQDVHCLLEAYDDDDVRSNSPHDSAVAVENDELPSYSGKGKGRASYNEQLLADGGVAHQGLADFAIELLPEIEHPRRSPPAPPAPKSVEFSWPNADEMARLEHERRAKRKREAEDRKAAMLLQEQLLAQQIEDERIVAEKARLRDCAVCGDSKDPLEFPAKAPTAACEHSVQTCKQCLESWMASEFDTKGTEGINCPECTQTLSYQDVQQAASIATFEAYDKISVRNALSALPEFAWCLGANCTSGQLNEENNNYMECVSCSYKQCLQHKVPWHTGETCTQYDYRTSGQQAKDEERKTEAMLDGVSKKCPGKGCGWRIQKTDGCDQ